MDQSIPLNSPDRPAKAAAGSLATRARAAGIHLSISLLVTASVFASMIALWYPWPVFLAAGAPELLLLVTVCDVVLDESQPFEPRMSSRQLDDGRIITPPLEDMFPFLPRDELAANVLRPE